MNSDEGDTAEKPRTTSDLRHNARGCPKVRLTLPASLQWIPVNWTWSNIKITIRCAAAAWFAVVLFVVPRVEVLMGRAGFLILIASFLSPPNDPFMAVLERECIIMLLVTGAWAWSCLGIRLADLPRKVRVPTATIADAVTGQYIEAAPTVILAVFLFLGSTFLLYVKARKGLGPYLFACVLACICLDISLITSALFPFPNYLIGRTIALPVVFHSAIALISSILIFPSSVSAQFTSRLQDVLTPLTEALDLHHVVLQTSHDSPIFATSVKRAAAMIARSEAALLPLASSGRLLQSDLIYCRFAPEDFVGLQKLARRMGGRANGMGVYFRLIDPCRERFPVTPVPTAPGTPGASTPNLLSQPPSPNGGDFERHTKSGHRTPPHSASHTPRSGSISRTTAHAHGGHHHAHRNMQHHHNLLHNSLIHLAIARGHKVEHAVGVFESHRYLNLEAAMHDPESEFYTNQTMELLSDSCRELLGRCRETLFGVKEWLAQVRQGRFNFWVSAVEKKKEREETAERLHVLRNKLSSTLDQFRDEKRHRVLDPYRSAFEVKVDKHAEQDVPAHRYLFNCYLYQYHLIQFSITTLEMVDEAIALEKRRVRARIWLPARNLFRWSGWGVTTIVQHDDDEDPDYIEGLEPANLNDLGVPRCRDPDALPPQNTIEWVLNQVYRGLSSLGGGNIVFAIKAGILTILLSLPSFLSSSAAFAYDNKFVWGIFMGQLTLARFRGDTAFGLTARILSTFLGGVVGMVMWYISCGSGKGNAYGLAAVCAFCYPFFFYARVFWPGPFMTNIVFFMTANLVIGYSYQDLHIIAPGTPGFGVSIAWRRFVLVTVGVVAAFIFSFLPPSTTIRRYQRTMLATTSSEIGALYCSILSFANQRGEDDAQNIVTSLLAVRSKLKRSVTLRTNIMYEISLRGRWPAKRYQTVLDLQLELSYSLSHLMSIVEHMEPAWTRAFLRRTRFFDSDFQGDILAVITMISSSLRTGNPLPQITPCPLLDRFRLRYHGLEVIHQDSEEDYGLPRVLTLDTLQNEQYLVFCVGVATAYGIVTRLDRLMVATKEIVGEQYHIHGVGLSLRYGADQGHGGGSVHFKSPQDYRPAQDV